MSKAQILMVLLKSLLLLLMSLSLFVVVVVAAAAAADATADDIASLGVNGLLASLLVWLVG